MSFNPNACKHYNPDTDSIIITHDMVVTADDDYDDDGRYDPSWLGPVPNGHQYGYCRRCGQPFIWVWSGRIRHDEPKEVVLGWREATKEEIAAAYATHIQDLKDRATNTIQETVALKEALEKNLPQR